MTLKDMKFKNAKPQAKPYKISDGDGLYLLVNPNGSKWWRFRYTFEGREKGISFGVYPDITLESARDKRAAARKLVAENVDPSVARREEKAETTNTFRHVAAEWFSKIAHTWTPGHKDVIRRTLDKDILPVIGDKTISKIVPGDVLVALRVIESRAAFDAAHRACQICGQVFRYAIASGMATVDPSATLISVLRKADVKHYPAITEPKDVAVLLRAIDSYHGTFIIKHALKLLPLVFCRPGELRNAEWAEVDFEAAVWMIPPHKMKMRMAHIVPLSKQAIEILKSLYEVTGAGRYVFPAATSTQKTMCANSFSWAFDFMGYKDTMTSHGFRAMARTILDEVLQFPAHLIEHQLAHAVKDANGRSYNRTSHIEERKRMMQTWADYLDGLRVGCKVLPFIKRTGTNG
jgi:integrase